MKYQPIITKTSMILNLEKPIYQSFFAIWKKWLDIAKRRKLNMIVNSPLGKSTYTYKSWMNGAKKLKRFYKDPEVPMIFYGREILPGIKARELRKKQEAKQEQGWTKEGAKRFLEAGRSLFKHI